MITVSQKTHYTVEPIPGWTERRRHFHSISAACRYMARIRLMDWIEGTTEQGRHQCMCKRGEDELGPVVIEQCARCRIFDVPATPWDAKSRYQRLLTAYARLLRAAWEGGWLRPFPARRGGPMYGWEGE